MQIIFTEQEQKEVKQFIQRATDIIKVTVAICVLVGIFIMCGKIETEYNIEAQVIQHTDRMYTVQDVAGYMWAFEDDREFAVGTTVQLKMHNGHTETSRLDDYILKVIKY